MPRYENQSRINACRVILNLAEFIKTKAASPAEAAEAADCGRLLRQRITKLKTPRRLG
jgi:hypothetical protein